MPDAAPLPHRTLAHNGARANHRLLAACARLPREEWTAPRTGFSPSLRATLNRILVNGRFYVDAMEGGTLGPAAWADPEPRADAPALRAAQGEVDRRLSALSKGWTRPACRAPWRSTAAPAASGANAPAGSCCTCSSTTSTTAARPTPC